MPSLALVLMSAVASPTAYSLSPYHVWRNAMFGANTGNPAIAGDAANLDQDSLSNLIEYGSGTLPGTWDQAPALGLSASGISLTLKRDSAATDVTLTAQGSDDLAGTWTDLASSVNGAAFAPLVPDVQVSESGTEVKTVTVTDGRPLTGNARFLRLKATRKPTPTVAAVVGATWCGRHVGS